MSTLPKGDHTAGEIEIVRQVPIYTNRYLSIFNDEVIFPSGAAGTYFRVSSASNRSVGILPIAPDGRLLLIRNYRHAARGWAYEMPKGEALEGEDPVEAAGRELMEETGLGFEKLVFIGEYCESPAVFSGKMRCYAALNCVPREASHPEQTEAISGLQPFTPAEYLSGSEARLDFDDAMTTLAVLRYLREKESLKDGI